MRIAFVSYDFGEYSIRHASALAEYAEVLLVLADNVACEYQHLLSPRVTLYKFPRPRLRQPLRQYLAIRKILGRIRQFAPDVVHFQSGHLWFNLALRRLRRYPLVLTVHNPRHHVGDRNSRRTPQYIMDYGYRQADQIVLHGESLKQQVHAELGIAEDHIHVIPHIAMGERAADARIAEDPRMLLFFGRIWAYKGLEFLIRAEPLISAHIPDVRIVIAGEGESFEPYRALMVHPERFEVHNRRISNDQRERLFAEAAIVVLPYIGATQSGVVPVAYTHAKPVVATRVGSLPESVEDGVTGLLVPPGDEQALAEAIVKLLRNDAWRRQLGQQGYTKLNAECAPAVVARRHLEVYAAAAHLHARCRHPQQGSPVAALVRAEAGPSVAPPSSNPSAAHAISRDHR